MDTQNYIPIKVKIQRKTMKFDSVFAGALESAYSLNWGAREIWGQDLGTFMISRPI